MKATLEAKRERLAQRQNDMYQAMNQVQQAKARQKSLQEIQENYAGFLSRRESCIASQKPINWDCWRSG